MLPVRMPTQSDGYGSSSSSSEARFADRTARSGGCQFACSLRSDSINNTVDRHSPCAQSAAATNIVTATPTGRYKTIFSNTFIARFATVQQNS